jgi:hypothetical protein
MKNTTAHHIYQHPPENLYYKRGREFCYDDDPENISYSTYPENGTFLHKTMQALKLVNS